MQFVLYYTFILFFYIFQKFLYEHNREQHCARNNLWTHTHKKMYENNLKIKLGYVDCFFNKSTCEN